ncbi:MAG: hypothetical protein ACOY3Y_15575 [Acidobacteriota bacterium]
MAVFLARAMAGGQALPISGSIPGFGEFDCRAGGVSVFSDVPPEDAACTHVHFVAAEGVTAGCGQGAYCPTAAVGRDQMAVFLTKAFDLVLYGP